MAREPKQAHLKHYRKEENVDFVTLEQYFPVVNAFGVPVNVRLDIALGTSEEMRSVPLLTKREKLFSKKGKNPQ